MKRRLSCFGIAALAALSAPALRAEVPSLIAIRNARVVTVSGPVLPRATVVLRGGLIDDVGESVTIPPGAWIVDGDGLTVYPGLVDALDSVGITDPSALESSPQPRRGAGPAQPAFGTPTAARGPEDRPSTTSWLRAADLVKPDDPRVASLRSAGFTSAVSFPMRGIVAGQGAVIDLAGERGGDMVVATPAGQFFTVRTQGFVSYPGSLMGVIAYIRQLYLDAAYARTVSAMYASSHSGMKRPPYDRALEGLIDSPRILLPADRRVEIDRMIRFGKELAQPTVLYGMQEGYRSADLLKAAGAPVLVNLKWPAAPRDGDPNAYVTLNTLVLRDKAPATPAALEKAGVPFAFYTGGLTAPREIKAAVRRALDNGLSPEAALRAMTLEPARIYGVADRLGSIDKGKIANLVVTKGDLFGEKSEIKFILVDGQKFEPEPESDSPPGAPPARGSMTAEVRQ